MSCFFAGSSLTTSLLSEWLFVLGRRTDDQERTQTNSRAFLLLLISFSLQSSVYWELFERPEEFASPFQACLVICSLPCWNCPIDHRQVWNLLLAVLCRGHFVFFATFSERLWGAAWCDSVSLGQCCPSERDRRRCSLSIVYMYVVLRRSAIVLEHGF